MYSEIKSEFVKNELKKTAWKDREYIEDLIKIEELATGVWKGVIVFHWTNHFPRKYPQHWKAIWQELNPKEYKEWFDRVQKEEKRDKRQEARWKKEEKEELQQEKKEWQKMKEN